MVYLKVKNEIKEAMKSKDVVKRDVLKMVMNKANAIVKETDPQNQISEIADEVMLQAIRKEMKQLEQTKDALKDKTDSDLFKETAKKIEVLAGYLPKMMSTEEVESSVKSILSSGDFTNFGQKMKAVMQELKGKADNKLIKEVVEQYK